MCSAFKAPKCDSHGNEVMAQVTATFHTCSLSLQPKDYSIQHWVLHRISIERIQIYHVIHCCAEKYNELTT
jgi:hypothetical protein